MKRRRSYKYYIRKSHRYLGIFIGIQFLLWTIGGFYFSWTNIEEIRGEHLRKETSEIKFQPNFISPTEIFSKLKAENKDLHVKNIRLVKIKEVPFYEFEVSAPERNFFIANTLTGKIQPKISEAEAKQIASDSLKKPLKITGSEYLTEKNVNSHHEYREKPLPAWAITFENGLTVYLSAENGQIGAFRTTKWRIFDFLWMLHTMDFYGRDNINNYFLRGFSILGIITILSGFLLFFISSRFFRKWLFRQRINKS